MDTDFVLGKIVYSTKYVAYVTTKSINGANTDACWTFRYKVFYLSATRSFKKRDAARTTVLDNDIIIFLIDTLSAAVLFKG